MTAKHIRRTKYISAEGDRDKSFLDYVKRLYQPGKHIKIDNAHGGSPVVQIRGIKENQIASAYDTRIALFDADRGEREVREALSEAARAQIECIIADQNIECEILRIKGVSKKCLSRARANAKSAKKEFQSEFKLKQENDDVEWGKYFPKETLEDARERVSWLNEVIKLFER